MLGKGCRLVVWFTDHGWLGGVISECDASDGTFYLRFNDGYEGWYVLDESSWIATEVLDGGLRATEGQNQSFKVVGSWHPDDEVEVAEVEVELTEQELREAEVEIVEAERRADDFAVDAAAFAPSPSTLNVSWTAVDYLDAERGVSAHYWRQGTAPVQAALPRVPLPTPPRPGPGQLSGPGDEGEGRSALERDGTSGSVERMPMPSPNPSSATFILRGRHQHARPSSAAAPAVGVWIFHVAMVLLSVGPLAALSLAASRRVMLLFVDCSAVNTSTTGDSGTSSLRIQEQEQEQRTQYYCRPAESGDGRMSGWEDVRGGWCTEMLDIGMSNMFISFPVATSLPRVEAFFGGIVWGNMERVEGRDTGADDAAFERPEDEEGRFWANVGSSGTFVVDGFGEGLARVEAFSVMNISAFSLAFVGILLFPLMRLIFLCCDGRCRHTRLRAIGDATRGWRFDASAACWWGVVAALATAAWVRVPGVERYLRDLDTWAHFYPEGCAFEKREASSAVDAFAVGAGLCAALAAGFIGHGLLGLPAAARRVKRRPLAESSATRVTELGIVLGSNAAHTTPSTSSSPPGESPAVNAREGTELGSNGPCASSSSHSESGELSTREGNRAAGVPGRHRVSPSVQCVPLPLPV